MKRKLLVIAAVMVVLITAMCASAFAVEVVDSGTCGENLTWTLDSDGVLTISGEGEMTSNPWSEYKGVIKSVIISDGVTSITWCAFEEHTNVTSVMIPDSVTEIKDMAFHSCSSLIRIYIPASVKSIGGYVFSNCSSLIGITVDKDNPNYCSDDYGVLFDKNKTIIYQVPETITEYTIPETVINLDEVFEGCTALKKVVIPNTITAIGVRAFGGCESLMIVKIPNSVQSINYTAFYGCSSPKSILFPESVIRVDNSAFLGCTLLTDIYYSGTEDQWKAISIEEGNDPLLNATIHFNYNPSRPPWGHRR